jgi:hypothetical protein
MQYARDRWEVIFGCLSHLTLVLVRMRAPVTALTSQQSSSPTWHTQVSVTLSLFLLVCNFLCCFAVQFHFTLPSSCLACEFIYFLFELSYLLIISCAFWLGYFLPYILIFIGFIRLPNLLPTAVFHWRCCQNISTTFPASVKFFIFCSWIYYISLCSADRWETKRLWGVIYVS